MTTSLLDRVRGAMRRHDLVRPGARLIVGLSGGGDSVALVLLLRALAESGDPRFVLAGVAHFNHRLRGDASDADERFCRELAAQWALPIEVAAEDVAARARAGRTSIEAAARTARYAFLDRVADRLGADRIAVGHTRDDQAETFLLRLLRGAGTRGLSGIRPRVGRVIRPLLDLTREELRRYLRQCHQPFVEDASNRDLRLLRNRLRLEIIPYLQERVGPNLVDVLAREATLAREDADYLEQAANEAARALVSSAEGRVELDAAALLALPPALARRAARGALQAVAGARFVGFDHVDALLRLAAGDRGLAGPLDLPGQRATRAGGRVTLVRRLGRAGPREPVGAWCYPLAVPGETRVLELGVAISAELRERFDRGAVTDLSARGDRVALDGGALDRPLAVRTRRPGDALRPLGARGRRKLQDFFVDRKIPRAVRDAVPLVVDGRDRIVWVAGHTLADDFRITAHTEAVLLLTVRRLGGAR